MSFVVLLFFLYISIMVRPLILFMYTFRTSSRTREWFFSSKHHCISEAAGSLALLPLERMN